LSDQKIRNGKRQEAPGRGGTEAAEPRPHRERSDTTAASLHAALQQAAGWRVRQGPAALHVASLKCWAARLTKGEPEEPSTA
jgi:hypothetical protein